MNGARFGCTDIGRCDEAKLPPALDERPYLGLQQTETRPAEERYDCVHCIGAGELAPQLMDQRHVLGPVEQEGGMGQPVLWSFRGVRDGEPRGCRRDPGQRVARWDGGSVWEKFWIQCLEHLRRQSNTTFEVVLLQCAQRLSQVRCHMPSEGVLDPVDLLLSPFESMSGSLEFLKGFGHRFRNEGFVETRRQFVGHGRSCAAVGTATLPSPWQDRALSFGMGTAPPPHPHPSSAATSSALRGTTAVSTAAAGIWSTTMLRQ